MSTNADFHFLEKQVVRAIVRELIQAPLPLVLCSEEAPFGFRTLALELIVLIFRIEGATYISAYIHVPSNMH